MSQKNLNSKEHLQNHLYNLSPELHILVIS